MYKNILEQILALESTMPDVYCHVHVGDEVKRIEICKHSALVIFALNIVLVLEGKRLAYRVSSLDMIIDQVLEITQGKLMSLPIIREEPLLCLRDNAFQVMGHFTKITKEEWAEGKIHHIAMGEVLDYAYTGEDWIGIDSDHFNVSYNIGDYTIALYCFNVPKSGYTNAIRSKILEDLGKYRTALKPYGYEVVLSIMLVSEDGYSFLTSPPEVTM